MHSGICPSSYKRSAVVIDGFSSAQNEIVRILRIKLNSVSIIKTLFLCALIAGIELNSLSSVSAHGQGFARICRIYGYGLRHVSDAGRRRVGNASIDVFSCRCLSHNGFVSVSLCNELIRIREHVF